MLRTLLAISHISWISDAFIHKHLSIFSSHDIWMIINELSQINDKISQDTISMNYAWADDVIQQCYQNNIKILPIYDPLYPRKLKELSNPPSILYLLGNIKLLEERIIAIIGTRHSTPLWDLIANKIWHYFSQKNVLCNGLVNGIDKNSVITDNGVLNNVIWILSWGLNYTTTSSKTTSELAEKVLSHEWLLVSEVAPNQKEDKFSGSKSSRIQAWLSSGLILIQSSITWWSKYTLKAISKLNRTIGFINFLNNEEFRSSDSFSANRLLWEKWIKGLAEICDIKNVDTINIKQLINIDSINDYELFQKSINTQHQWLPMNRTLFN